MEITERGKYKLKSDLYVRLSNGCYTIDCGKVIEITQVDKSTRRVIGPQLRDWVNWKIDAEKEASWQKRR